MEGIDGEIIVVDNHSTDGSDLFFNNRFKEVAFFWNEKNVGFGRANNQALTYASGDYILFLNPDTIVPEDCFEKCISFIKSQNNLCALGIKMLDGSGNFLKESKRAFPSPITSLYKITGLARLFPHSKTFARYHLGNLSNQVTHEVDVLAGAFMMIPKDILAVTGGFDEDFFMYGEDIDLSFRIQKAGFKNFYFPGSSIIHFKGESTKKGSLVYVRLFYTAMSVFVKKHYGNARAGLFTFMIHVAIYLRATAATAARFLRWNGLPLIDAALILVSLWAVNIFWSVFIPSGTTYLPNLLTVAFSVFTILFFIASFFSGLYSEAFKQSALNKASVAVVVVVLPVYFLFREEFRFWGGALLFGWLLAFILMTIVRHFLLTLKVIESPDARVENNQAIVAGTIQEFVRVGSIIKKAGKKEAVLGRIATDGLFDASTLGTFDELSNILRLYRVEEVIFCEGDLSFRQIIQSLQHVPGHVRIKFFAEGSNAIIGSE